MKLQGKKALITGASQGIGKAIALAFAREGADVCISYKTSELEAKNTVSELINLGAFGKALFLDFLQTDGCKVFFDQALEALGQIDILVNCAAEYDMSSFLDLDKNQLDLLWKVGVLGPVELIQMTAKKMIEKNLSGSIINISSVVGVRPFLKRFSHATVKAALNMLTKSSALELGEYSIRVNAIAPGTIKTKEANSSSDPIKRFGELEDVANLAVFLGSEDSSWVTGQVIVVDGGSSLSFG